MAKGVIYIMSTAVDGLIKIGKTGSDNYEQRMNLLENSGYRNVTALKRIFAIEVDDYDAKEMLLHTIFAKSQVGGTELFALDINIAIQLLSSFEGNVVYPKKEKKEEIFEEATDNTMSQLIPDGKYVFERKNKGSKVHAIAVIKNGSWTLLKGSKLSPIDGKGGSNKAKEIRASLNLDEHGILQENVELGKCTPSFSGNIVIGGVVDGWTSWEDSKKRPINIYRQRTIAEE